MQAGSPDIIGICRGQGFVWEAKRPGGKEPSDIQKLQLKKWKRAGAIIVPYTADVDEAVDIVCNQCYV